MDFARKQLEKYGWKEGRGLGKSEDGISIALKPKLKFDNSGIGHDAGEQFTNNWWERVFNSAAKNLNVEVQDEQVQLKRQSEDSIEITTKNYSLKELEKNESLQYGSFLKTAKITDGGTEHYDVKIPESFNHFSTLSDEELFAACGGRTAHKGARHGLNLSGKLARLEKQEKMLMKKMKNVSLSDEKFNLEKKMKKVKKHKVEVTNETNPHEPESSSTSSRKKHKKKRKSVTFNDETVVKYYTPDLDTSYDSMPSSKDENSNDSTSVEFNNNNNNSIQNGSDEGIEQDMEEGKSEQEDNHRSFEEAQCSFNDLSKAERKKLKKKRKLEKKSSSATAKFIEEMKEESSFEEKCKKRKLESNEVLLKKKKKHNRDGTVINSIVKSLDNFCKISDDEK